jgi:hypothetical protein
MSTFARAASDRELAEWAIRWEGRVTLDGSRQAISDISLLPPGEFHITGIDLTGSVMSPKELEKLNGWLPCASFIFRVRYGIRAAGNEDANEVFKALGDSEESREIVFRLALLGQHQRAGQGAEVPGRVDQMKDLRCSSAV